MPRRRIFSHPYILGAAAFLISFGVYLRTLLPSVGYSGDTAKFQFIGTIPGIPHPPGYPLYVILTVLFGKIPIGNLAYRINLMSALFAALAVAILFFVLRRLIHDTAIAFPAALLFAFSRTFWSQAVVAEVYSLHVCFLTVVILCLILWAQEKCPRYFYLACFFYALSFGNHLLMITVLPAFVVFILLTDYQILLSKKTILTVLACILIGMLQYTYIFVKLDTAFSEIYTRGLSPDFSTFRGRLEGFLHFVTGAEFRSDMFAFSLREVVTERIPLFFSLLRENLFIVGIIAGCAGLCVMLKTATKTAIFLLLIIMGNLAYALNYDIDDIFVYFLPTYLMFCIFISFCARPFLGSDRKNTTLLRSAAPMRPTHPGVNTVDLSRNSPPAPLSCKERGSKSIWRQGRLFSPSLPKRGGRGVSSWTGASKLKSTVLPLAPPRRGIGRLRRHGI